MDESEKVPVSLPKGMQEYDAETSEPLYYLLEKPRCMVCLSAHVYKRKDQAGGLARMYLFFYVYSKSTTNKALHCIREQVVLAECLRLDWMWPPWDSVLKRSPMAQGLRVNFQLVSRASDRDRAVLRQDI